MALTVEFDKNGLTQIFLLIILEVRLVKLSTLKPNTTKDNHQNSNK
jgi:hypothetical protein